MNKTAEALIKLRKRKGVTQSDLAQKLGVSSQAVSKWERGENLPDSMLLLDIAKYYDVSVEEILTGEIKTQTNEEQVKTNFMVMVAGFIIVLSALPYFLFKNINFEVAILTTVVMFSIGALILLYAGLKSEIRK